MFLFFIWSKSKMCMHKQKSYFCLELQIHVDKHLRKFKQFVKSAVFYSYHSITLHRFPTAANRCWSLQAWPKDDLSILKAGDKAPDRGGNLEGKAMAKPKATRIAMNRVFFCEGWVLQQDPSTLRWRRGVGCRAQRGVSMRPYTFHSGWLTSSHGTFNIV